MQIFVVGYYGFGNCGDEICRAKTEQLLRHVFPSANCVFLMQQAKGGVEHVLRSQFFKILWHISCSDKVVLGGGGLFQTVTSKRSFYYYFFLVMWAFLFRVPVYGLGQGFSSVSGRISRFLLAWMLERFSGLSVRLGGHEILDESYIHKECLVGDMAFYRASTHSPSQSQLKQHCIGINVCKSSYANALEPLIASLQQEKAAVSGLAFHETEDLFALSALLPGDTPIDSVSDSVFYDLPSRSFRAVAMMRYHACVWAALQGLPFLALVYDDKVLAFAQSVGQPFVDMRQNGCAKNIVAKFYFLLEGYDQYLQKLLIGRDILLTNSLRHEEVFC